MRKTISTSEIENFGVESNFFFTEKFIFLIGNQIFLILKFAYSSDYSEKLKFGQKRNIFTPTGSKPGSGYSIELWKIYWKFDQILRKFK